MTGLMIQCLSVLIVLLSLAAVTPVSARPTEDPKAKANACLDRANEMMGQSKFEEQADAYFCAADETAKLPGAADRAARYRGLSHLARAWALYTRGVTGSLGRANLEEALRHIDLSVSFLQKPGHLAGLGEIAEGWRSYLLGVKAGLDSDFVAARTSLEKARRIALQAGTLIPPLRPQAERLVSLAQDQLDTVLISEILTDREAVQNRGGEINATLAELKERAEESAKPWYEGLTHLYRGMRLFDEAGSRLESWDYEDAGKLLDEAAISFQAAMQGAAGVARALRQEQFKSLVEGFRHAIEAEQHHGKALKSLLADGDPAQARGEFIAGVEGYRSAQAAFEQAGYPAGGIAAVRSTSKRLSERAAVMDESFSVKRIVLGVGGVFIATFLGVLGLLTSLAPRLRLSGFQVAWIAVIVGIIGAFGLQAPAILGALKEIPLGKAP